MGSPISDISPLAGLTQLEILDICGTEITDFSTLRKLTSLKELYLVETGISDVSPFRFPLDLIFGPKSVRLRGRDTKNGRIFVINSYVKV